MKKLITLFVLLASMASAQRTVVGVVRWRRAANTNQFWFVSAIETEALNPGPGITNKYMILALRQSRWENTNSQARIKRFYRRHGSNTHVLTKARVTTLTNNLPSGIRIAFTDDAYQALADAGLEPIPTEEP